MTQDNVQPETVEPTVQQPEPPQQVDVLALFKQIEALKIQREQAADNVTVLYGQLESLKNAYIQQSNELNEIKAASQVTTAA